MTLVIDASFVVAALIDTGPPGRWAEELISSDHLAAPHLMPIETANILRRAAASGRITEDVASQAHADLLDLRVDLVPYEALAPRAWELRACVTAYDACYVALAEHLHAPLATLDQRLSRAPGLGCSFRRPPQTPTQRCEHAGLP